MLLMKIVLLLKGFYEELAFSCLFDFIALLQLFFLEKQNGLVF